MLGQTLHNLVILLLSKHVLKITFSYLHLKFELNISKTDGVVAIFAC